MSSSSTPTSLPGFMPRSEWAAAHGVCDTTVKRWQDRGKVVVVYLGQQPYVDIEKTVARLRGEDKPRRGRAA
jgi:hypothetical protein